MEVSTTSGARKGSVWLLAVVFVGVGLGASAETPALKEGPWWWPTQGSWMETLRLAPDDADEPGGNGHPAHFGVTFGARMAFDGGTLVVGTLTSFASDKGRFSDGGDWVYVFERAADGTWRQAAKLVPDDAHQNDTFGFSVAVDGDAGVVAVGDPGPYEQTNKVYIFERLPDGGWNQTASFHRTNPAGKWGGAFGYSVAVSGHTVAAALADGELGTDPMTYVFEKIDGVWTETAALTWAGGRIAMAGETLVGQFGEHTSCVDKAICTHVWLQTIERVDGEWLPGAIIDPTAEHERSQTLAATLALSEDGRTIVIGSPVDCRVYGVHTQNKVDVETPLGVVDLKTVCAGSIGSAWIYELVDGQWTEVADIPNPDPNDSDYFGVSVAVSGGLVVIGAYGDGENGGDPKNLGKGAGAAYVYRRVGVTWELEAKLRNHDAGPVGGADFFGESVGVSNSVIAVGAPYDDQRGDGTPPPADDISDLHPAACGVVRCSGWDDGENAGSVYVFEPGSPLR